MKTSLKRQSTPRAWYRRRHLFVFYSCSFGYWACPAVGLEHFDLTPASNCRRTSFEAPPLVTGNPCLVASAFRNSWDQLAQLDSSSQIEGWKMVNMMNMCRTMSKITRLCNISHRNSMRRGFQRLHNFMTSLGKTASILAGSDRVPH